MTVEKMENLIEIFYGIARVFLVPWSQIHKLSACLKGLYIHCKDKIVFPLQSYRVFSKEQLDILNSLFDESKVAFSHSFLKPLLSF